MKASNITPFAFQKLTLITNSPSYNNTYYFFLDVQVYLGNNLLPTKIFGLSQIINAKIRTSEANAFIHGKRTHDPFINGFKNGLNIDEIVDILSSISDETPETKGVPKNFTLFFDPATAEVESFGVPPIRQLLGAA